VRYLAYLLLLANIGLFAWIYLQPPGSPPEYRPIPVPPGIESLVLLSERREHLKDKTASSVNSTETVEAATPPAGDETTGPQSLVEADPAGVSAGVMPEPTCQAIGPLMRKEEALAISQRLQDHGYKPYLRDGEVREPSGYWVYMPAMPAAQARRIVSRLDANGMDDYFIGKQNHISLGIFSSKAKAQARLAQVRDLNIEAILDQRYRTRTVYWLDIVERAEPLLSTPLWNDIQQQHADIRVQKVSCE